MTPSKPDPTQILELTLKLSGLTLIVFECLGGFVAISPSNKARGFAMPGMIMLRGTLSAIGTVFGGLGVFFLYCSFYRAEYAVYALMFLGSATAIAWSSPTTK